MNVAMGTLLRRPCIAAWALVVACGGASPDATAPSAESSGTSHDAVTSTSGAVETSTGAAPAETSSTSGSSSGGETTSAEGSSSSSGGPPIEVASGRPSGVFGGGPFYNDADTLLPRIKASGFSTVVLWTLHVGSDGQINFNEHPMISAEGEYVADPQWPAKVAALKDAPTSVTRIEFSVGAFGTTSFENIEALMDVEGVGPDTTLHRNFSTIRALFPEVDAINFDDESNYDVGSAGNFALMLDTLGFKVTLCPYTNSNFWSGLYAAVEDVAPGTIDRVLLQSYAGGAGNAPATWNRYFGGLVVEPGLWSLHGSSCGAGHTPASMTAQFEAWAEDTDGGWVWYVDDLLACEGDYALEDYAGAINSVFAR